MKVQIGEVIMGKVSQKLPIPNRTFKYLTPCLRKYGKEFEEKYNSVFKIALGLGDMVIVDQERKYEQHLFILLDSRIQDKNFIIFLDWIREQDFYEDDYVYGDIKKSPCHMVIIKVPNEHTSTFEKFTQGKYSEMYSLQDIDILFTKYPETKQVLTKDDNYKIRFVRRINRMFDTQLKPNEYEGELDVPPKKQEEFFE